MFNFNYGVYSFHQYDISKNYNSTPQVFSTQEAVCGNYNIFFPYATFCISYSVRHQGSHCW